MGTRRLGAVLLRSGLSGSGLIESPTKATEMWRLEFDAIRAEGAAYVLTNHPFLSGRPSRAQALDSLIDYVCSHDDVWVTSLEKIANHVRGLGLTPRTVTRPTRPTSRRRPDQEDRDRSDVVVRVAHPAHRIGRVSHRFQLGLRTRKRLP